MTDPYSPRDLLTNPKVVIDTVVPPLVFVGVNALAGLMPAALAALAFSVTVVAVRLLRRDRLVYAFSGLLGVVASVGFALLNREAADYFVPGIITSAVMAVACVVSILVRRPLIAVTSAVLYQWPLEWYWHPKVRPAYSEITWAWALLYAGRAGVQYVLVDREAIGLLTVFRLATGLPAFALLLVITYAYITRRLDALGAPSVDEWRVAQAKARAAT